MIFWTTACLKQFMEDPDFTWHKARLMKKGFSQFSLEGLACQLAPESWPVRYRPYRLLHICPQPQRSSWHSSWRLLPMILDLNHMNEGSVIFVYRASCLIVVPVHSRASVWAILSGVGELSGHQHPKLCILTAAAPLPALPRRPLVVGVTAAHGGGALSTGARHCKCNACWSYSVDECWLSGCWETQMKTDRETEIKKRERETGKVSILCWTWTRPFLLLTTSRQMDWKGYLQAITF